MYIIGDTHGLQNLYNILKSYTEQHEINDDVFIHVGDVGIGFDKWKRDRHELQKIDALMRNAQCRLLMIRGNHDNPIYWSEDLDTLPEYANAVQDLQSLTNIELISDYTVSTINNKRILFVGGAISVDRNLRTEGRDYWRDEAIRMFPLDVFEQEKYNGVDTLITHSNLNLLPPFGNVYELFGQELGDDLTKERAYLTALYNKLNDRHPITHYFYGHHHQANVSYVNNTRFECVDQDTIVEWRV